MTSTLYNAATTLFRASSQLIIRSSQALLLTALFLSTAYYCGWIHRFIIYIIESEASKIINRTPITVGSIEFDLLRGHAWIFGCRCFLKEMVFKFLTSLEPLFTLSIWTPFAGLGVTNSADNSAYW